MQRIQIKPDVVMNSSKLLPASSVANIQDDLTRVRARLDHRIRSRHNIDGRLSKVIREIDDIERKMSKIKNFTQQSMERYTQVERDLANRSSRFNRLQSPNLMKRGNWWESYFSSDKKTRNRLINLLFPWLQMTFQRHFGLLYPIGPALSFNKWINPNSLREVTFSDVEKQAIVDYLKRVENGEVPSNMDQYAGMTNRYEGYIGENNIFGQPLGGNAPKNVETVATILDFLPFIGNLKAASEAYLGYDPLTGRKLEDWERGVAAAAILGGGAAKLGGKVVPKVFDKVGDVGKGPGKTVQPNDVVPYRPSNSPLENHHGVMDVWAKHNVPNYVSRGGNTPTVVLTKEQHNATKAVYREWLYEKTGKKVGGKIDWQSVSPKEIQELTERMFDVANVPKSSRQEYYNYFNKYNYRE